MPFVTSSDGVENFYKDWGSKDAQPIMFHHGWPLSADDWDAQLLFFVQKGYWVIAHDRRGHGRSTQVSDGHDMDHYAADAFAVVEALDLRNAIHIGHSTGGGEVARYVAKLGQPASRVAKAVLVSAVPPLMVKTDNNPEGLPIGEFDGFRTALYTGLRIGELAGLRWQDVDVTDRRLRVRQTVYWIKGVAAFGEPKTRKCARTLTLPRPVIAALQEQSDRHAFLKRQAAHRWRPYDLVFSSVLGTPIDNSNVDRRLRVLLDKAGLPKGGFHMLRHSCASLLVSQGIQMRTVMEQLGHSQMSLTSDLTAHVAPAMLDDAADALETALNGT